MVRASTTAPNPNFYQSLALNVFNGNRGNLDFEQIKHLLNDTTLDATNFALVCSASVRPEGVWDLARHLLQCETTTKALQAVELLLQYNLPEDEVDLLPTMSLCRDDFGEKLLSYIEKRTRSGLLAYDDEQLNDNFTREEQSYKEQGSHPDETLFVLEGGAGRDVEANEDIANANENVNNLEEHFNTSDEVIGLKNDEQLDKTGDGEKKEDDQSKEKERETVRPSSEDSSKNEEKTEQQQVIQNTASPYTSPPRRITRSDSVVSEISYNSAISEASHLRRSTRKTRQSKSRLPVGDTIPEDKELKSKAKEKYVLKNKDKGEVAAEEPPKKNATEFEQQDQGIIQSKPHSSSTITTPRRRTRSSSAASEMSHHSATSEASSLRRSTRKRQTKPSSLPGDTIPENEEVNNNELPPPTASTVTTASKKQRKNMEENEGLNVSDDYITTPPKFSDTGAVVPTSSVRRSTRKRVSTKAL